MAMSRIKNLPIKLIKQYFPLQTSTHDISYLPCHRKSEKPNDTDNMNLLDSKDAEDSDSDSDVAIVLSVLTNGKTDRISSSTLKTVGVVPGKGPPPEAPVTCCMSGCANCVYIAYAEELKLYYGDGGEKAREALEQIEDHSLKAFLKLELDL